MVLIESDDIFLFLDKATDDLNLSPHSWWIFKIIGSYIHVLEDRRIEEEYNEVENDTL